MLQAHENAEQSTEAVLQVGRYTVYGVIGRGGMATVHLGRLQGAAGFGRTVAIKRLHPSLAASEGFATRFVTEAKLASRIQHPNVVTTLDALARDGELLLVMDHVLGDSLAGVLAASPEPIPVPIAVAIAVDVLRGLHAAHEATDERGEPLKLVHRDVSPHNVLVGADGVARLLDFGIAEVPSEAASEHVEGKEAYMAPEQLYGEPVDRRADVYAVGVMLWECLTGKRLFAAAAGESTATRVLDAPVDRPGVVATGVSDALDAVVMASLDRDPDGRHADAQALEGALRAATSPAPPTDVAAFLAVRCADTLAERRRALGAVEAREPDRASATSSKPRWSVLAGVAAIVAAAGWVVAGGEAAPPSDAATRAPTTVEHAVPPAPTASVPSPALAPPSVTTASLPSAATAPLPPPRRVSPPPATAPSLDCDPPFILDDKGHKRYKRGCFQ